MMGYVTPRPLQKFVLFRVRAVHQVKVETEQAPRSFYWVRCTKINRLIAVSQHASVYINTGEVC